jgi:hypothetical protein
MNNIYRYTHDDNVRKKVLRLWEDSLISGKHHVASQIYDVNMPMLNSPFEHDFSITEPMLQLIETTNDPAIFGNLARIVRQHQEGMIRLRNRIQELEKLPKTVNRLCMILNGKEPSSERRVQFDPYDGGIPAHSPTTQFLYHGYDSEEKMLRRLNNGMALPPDFKKELGIEK